MVIMIMKKCVWIIWTVRGRERKKKPDPPHASGGLLHSTARAASHSHLAPSLRLLSHLRHITHCLHTAARCCLHGCICTASERCISSQAPPPVPSCKHSCPVLLLLLHLRQRH